MKKIFFLLFLGVLLFNNNELSAMLGEEKEVEYSSETPTVSSENKNKKIIIAHYFRRRLVLTLDKNNISATTEDAKAVKHFLSNREIFIEGINERNDRMQKEEEDHKSALVKQYNDGFRKGYAKKVKHQDWLFASTGFVAGVAVMGAAWYLWNSKHNS